MAMVYFRFEVLVKLISFAEEKAERISEVAFLRADGFCRSR